MLAILRDAGFSNASAAGAHRSLLVLAFGFAASSDLEALARVERLTRERLETVDEERYLVLVHARETFLGSLVGEAAFLYALDSFLDGLEARLRRERPGR
jgi:Tetracyclin repressor-like, C-terminal domain